MLDGIPEKQQRWFHRHPKAALLFFVISVVVVLDSISGRFFLIPPHEIPNPYYHHDLREKNCKARLNWGNKEYYIYTNSLGFKDGRRRQVTLVPGGYRILFLGDSFTEGVGLPYEKTFVGIIDTELGKRNIEVLNGSVSSYSPRLYYLKLQYLLEKVGLRFNELYLYLDMGDVLDEVNYEHFKSASGRGALMSFLRIHRFLLYHSFCYSTFFNYARDKVAFVKSARQALRGYPREDFDYYDSRYTWHEKPELPDRFGRRGMALAEENMQKVYELCKRYNIKITIGVFPAPRLLTTREAESEYYEKFWERFCAKWNIPFINLFPDFIKELKPPDYEFEFFIPNDVHFNEFGHMLIARAWLKRYQQQGFAAQNQDTRMAFP